MKTDSSFEKAIRFEVKGDVLIKPPEAVASYDGFFHCPQLIVETERTYSPSWSHLARFTFDLLFPECLSHQRTRTVTKSPRHQRFN
jgi:hypothetical protein